MTTFDLKTNFLPCLALGRPLEHARIRRLNLSSPKSEGSCLRVRSCSATSERSPGRYSSQLSITASYERASQSVTAKAFE
jgi:hypothetical protein